MEQRLVIVLAAAAAALLLLMPAPVPPEDVDDEPQYEPPDAIDHATAIFQEVGELMFESGTNNNEAANLAAFMWMIRVSEGTSGPNGYRTIVGGSLFDSFAAHPNQKIWLPNLRIHSTAAGAYQNLRRTWDGVRAKLKLPDFSPASQDKAAIELIRQRGALADVRAGRFAVAVEKCKKEWASLPGAGYGQRENKLATLQAAYTKAGGTIA